MFIYMPTQNPLNIKGNSWDIFKGEKQNYVCIQFNENSTYQEL